MFLQSAEEGILLRKCPRLHIEFAIWVKKYLRLHIEFAIWVKKCPLSHAGTYIFLTLCRLSHAGIRIFSVKFTLEILVREVNFLLLPVGEDILSFKLIFRCPLYEFVYKIKSL